jgi:hypothetical protein
MENKHKYAFRYINDKKITNFQSALQNENWKVYKQENVKSKFNIFLHISLLNFENSFPLVYKKKKNVTNNWITMHLRISSKHRRTLHSLLTKSGDRLKSYYKKCCTILAKVITQAKKLHYYKFIHKSENKIQTTWMINMNQLNIKKWTT